MSLLSTLVVIPTLDRRTLLADALASVAAQTQLPDVVVVCDVGNAGPFDVPSALTGRVRHMRSSATTVGLQRNEAVAAAPGELITFLDDDDMWRPDHLERLVEAFRAPEIEFAYRDVAVIRERVESGQRVVLETRTIDRDWSPSLMRTHDFIAPSAWCVRRSTFEHLGGFDAAFRYSDDWDFLMRLARHTIPRRVPGIGAEVRMRSSDNASLDVGEERIADLRRLEQRYGLERLEPLTFWEVAEVAAQKALQK